MILRRRKLHSLQPAGRVERADSGKVVWRPWVSNGMLSLLDQAIVSGTNFLTTVIVARAAGERELGLYSIAFTILVLLLGAQESLVTLPYTYFSHRAKGAKLPQLRGDAVMHQGGLSIVASLLLLAAGLGVQQWSGSGEFAWVLYALGLTVAVLTLRDFVRRMAFADLRLRVPVVLDVLVCVLQLAGIWVLARQGYLTASITLLWGGLASVTASAVIYLWMRPDVKLRYRRFLPSVRKNWRFGGWLLFGQLLGIANGYLMHWLLAIMMGAAKAGIYAACTTPVYFANPVVIGVGNILAPALSRIGADRGGRAMRRPVLLASAFLALVLGSVLVVVALFGDKLLKFLFGESFAGNGTVAAVITLGILIRAMGVAPENALRALNSSSTIFAGQLITFVLSFGAAMVLIPLYGLIGAAWALAFAAACGNLFRWVCFWRKSAPATAA